VFDVLINFKFILFVHLLTVTVGREKHLSV